LWHDGALVTSRPYSERRAAPGTLTGEDPVSWSQTGQEQSDPGTSLRSPGRVR
jgi:hypothetical protein